MDLTSDDVQDILSLLDGLPFAEMQLRTARFSLTLRRTADGGWTQETQIRSEPAVTPTAAEAGGATVADEVTEADRNAEASESDRAGEAAEAVGVAGAEGVAEAAGVAGAEGVAGAKADTGTGGGPVPDGLRAVRAPLPGTFYRAPMPGAPPFVDTGSSVEPDTVVAIIETMKLMNSVYAGVRGTVAEILLANAQPAEQDAALMWIREDR